MRDLEIVFSPVTRVSKSRTIQLYDVHCARLAAHFDNYTTNPMTYTLLLSPGIFVDGGVVFEKPWKVTDLSAMGAEATPEPVAPKPKVLNVKWVDDNGTEKKEARYGEEVNLQIEIDNKEGDVVQIVIERENGEDFETGTSKIVLKEPIDVNNIAELTGFIIRKKWEETKGAGDDILIATVTYESSFRKSYKLQITPKVEAIAHFRPITSWNGEKYGFDWIRIGDSGLSGDTIPSAYKDIIGNYYMGSGATKRLAGDGEVINGAATFVNEQTVFDNYKKDFNPTPISWKLDSAGNPEEYYTPWLSILRIPDTHADYDPSNPDPIIELVLNIEVKTEPERIKLKFENTYFEIITPGATLEKDTQFDHLVLATSAKTVGTRKITLTIKNLHTLQKNQKIEVLAEEKQPDLYNIVKHSLK